MLTIFTTAKPFRGHSSVIQRNALESWTRLHPDVEVILFGDDEGATEVCRDLGIRHEPRVEKNEFGTKRLDYFFDRAQEIAAHSIVCYVNSDIILLDDFARAIERLSVLVEPFLMVGRRWDTDFTQPINFATDKWRETVRYAALQANNQRPWQWIDYFAFSRGLFHRKIPQFVIGRVHWDNRVAASKRNAYRSCRIGERLRPAT
jgi:hypothetical protein